MWREAAIDPQRNQVWYQQGKCSEKKPSGDLANGGEAKPEGTLIADDGRRYPVACGVREAGLEVEPSRIVMSGRLASALFDLQGNGAGKECSRPRILAQERKLMRPC